MQAGGPEDVECSLTWLLESMGSKRSALVGILEEAAERGTRLSATPKSVEAAREIFPEVDQLNLRTSQ